MCLCGYPTHYSFQYFFDTKQVESKGNGNEVYLAENYKADIELADNIFRKLIAEGTNSDTKD